MKPCEVYAKMLEAQGLLVQTEPDGKLHFKYEATVTNCSRTLATCNTSVSARATKSSQGSGDRMRWPKRTSSRADRRWLRCMCFRDAPYDFR